MTKWDKLINQSSLKNLTTYYTSQSSEKIELSNKIDPNFLFANKTLLKNLLANLQKSPTEWKSGLVKCGFEKIESRGLNNKECYSLVPIISITNGEQNWIIKIHDFTVCDHDKFVISRLVSIMILASNVYWVMKMIKTKMSDIYISNFQDKVTIMIFRAQIPLVLIQI